MSWEFRIILKGNENFEKKYDFYVNNNKDLHGCLISSLVYTLMTAMQLTDSDGVKLESFTAGKCEDNLPESKIEATEVPKETRAVLE